MKTLKEKLKQLLEEAHEDHYHAWEYHVDAILSAVLTALPEKKSNPIQLAQAGRITQASVSTEYSMGFNACIDTIKERLEE